MKILDCYKNGTMTMVSYSLDKDEIAKVNAYFGEELSECRLNFGYEDGVLLPGCVQVMSDDMDSNFDSTVEEIASILNIDVVYAKEPIYTMTLEAYNTEGIDFDQLDRLLEGKGSFTIHDGYGCLTCRNLETFIKAEEMVWNLSAGYSDEEWADILKAPQNFICDIVEA